jgi:hypothetical protein
MSTPAAQLMKVLEAEVPRAFGFLAERGYETLAEESGRFAWTSAEIGVEVGYDSHERRVVTVLDAFVGDRHARASLPCLYVETGCGPAQDVHENAVSTHTVRRAVEAQSSALAAVLAIVEQRGTEVLLRCHGR